MYTVRYWYIYMNVTLNQSDLLNPSLLKRARAPSGRLPLAFSRSPLDSLLAGFLLLFLILDDFHSVLHPRIFSLSRLTGWASTPTPLGAPSLVVWLGLTTSWRRTTERKLSGLWGCCDGTFHTFHQVLGWSSCLRSPTNRHALVLPGEFVSPDSDCHSWFYHCLLSLRRLRWVPVPMHSPSVVSRNPHDIRATDGYGAIIRPSPPGPPFLTTLHLGSN